MLRALELRGQSGMKIAFASYLSYVAPVVNVEDRHAKIKGKTGQVGFVEVSGAREDGSPVSVDKTCFVLSVFEVGWRVDQNAHLTVGNDRRKGLSM